MQEQIALGMGCFWGAEKRMAQLIGVTDVESGYCNGDSELTDYEQVLGLEKQIKLGLTQARNHAEVVLVSFDNDIIGLESVLASFWENHDPTQKDRQGNDTGTNYRSAIYAFNQQQITLAHQSMQRYQEALTQAGLGQIQTEIALIAHYNRAEEYHQKYLEKHPHGYCGLGGTGVKYPPSQI